VWAKDHTNYNHLLNIKNLSRIVRPLHWFFMAYRLNILSDLSSKHLPCVHTSWLSIPICFSRS